jgi:hypothetical protein
MGLVQLESLQLDVRRLQLEHDLLMRANELLKKETGIDRQVLTNREKTLLADALRQKLGPKLLFLSSSPNAGH